MKTNKTNILSATLITGAIAGLILMSNIVLSSATTMQSNNNTGTTAAATTNTKSSNDQVIMHIDAAISAIKKWRQ